MKLKLIIFVFTVIFLCHIGFSIKLTRRSKSSFSKKAREPPTKQLVEGLNIGDYPAQFDEVKKEFASFVLTPTQCSLNKNTAVKRIHWETVKSTFKEDKETMRKYLHFRLMSVIMMIKDVFTTKSREFITTGLTPNTFDGSSENFDTPTVKVKIGVTSSNEIVGRYNFAASGSTSYTSDIDFTVDFIPTSSSVSIYQRLQAMSKFIKDFNEVFSTVYGTTSLETFDVNLYSSDFGNYDVITELISLKADSNKWKYFVNANRLSQMMLAYNDALDQLKRAHPNTLVEKNSTIIGKMNALYTASVPDNEFCGQYLLKPTDSGTLNPITQSRSTVQRERNDAMVLHSSNAGTENSNTLRKLCHVLAANFFALEAYISYGSILEIKALQKARPPPVYPPSERVQKEARDRQAKQFISSLDQNGIIDAVLMNFAYAMEHYYEAALKANPDVDDYKKKFAKYSARVYVEKSFLTNQEHKKCWEDAFKDSGLITTKEPTRGNVKDIIAEFKLKVFGDPNTNTPALEFPAERRFPVSVKFFEIGYRCLNHYGFIIQ